MDIFEYIVLQISRNQEHIWPFGCGFVNFVHIKYNQLGISGIILTLYLQKNLVFLHIFRIRITTIMVGSKNYLHIVNKRIRLYNINILWNISSIYFGLKNRNLDNFQCIYLKKEYILRYIINKFFYFLHIFNNKDLHISKYKCSNLSNKTLLGKKCINYSNLLHINSTQVDTEYTHLR